VLITGLHGFERTVTCALDDDPAVIAERVRETLEEQQRPYSPVTTSIPKFPAC
jgi:hypothetical protein